MPIDIKFESVDTTKFAAATDYVFEHTERVLPRIINRGALVSLIGGAGVTGAMKRTMKALASAILAVPEKLVAGRVMTAHKGQKFTRDQIKELVRREYRRRLSAIGYTANVGWNKAVIDLGGKGIGRHAVGKGYAAYGYAKPAQIGQNEALMVNTAPVAAEIGEQALQEALDQTAADMISYAGGQVDEIFNQAGSR